MAWQGMRYGPTGSRGTVGLTRGAIRQGRWLVPGMTGPHQLELDCGRVGRGPMHALVDKRLALTFPKPNVQHPAVMSEERVVDGLRLAVYAESRDGGNTIDCDVFVEGRSLLTGQPIENVSGWGEQAVRAATEKRRTGPLEFAALAAAIMLGMTGMRTLGTIFTAPSPRVSPLLLAAGAVATYAAVLGVGYWAIVGLRRRPSLTRGRAMLAASVLIAGEIVVLMVTLTVVILLTRA